MGTSCSRLSLPYGRGEPIRKSEPLTSPIVKELFDHYLQDTSENNAPSRRFLLIGKDRTRFGDLDLPSINTPKGKRPKTMKRQIYLLCLYLTWKVKVIARIRLKINAQGSTYVSSLFFTVYISCTYSFYGICTVFALYFICTVYNIYIYI